MEPTIEIPDDLRFVPWSDERRRIHLEETLAKAPDPDAIWVFGLWVFDLGSPIRTP